MTLSNKATILEQSNLRQALEICREIEDIPGKVVVYEQLANIELQLDNLHQAEDLPSHQNPIIMKSIIGKVQLVHTFLIDYESFLLEFADSEGVTSLKILISNHYRIR